MRSTGECPVCARQVALTPSRGLIKTHVTQGERCPGMGLEPVDGSRVNPADPAMAPVPTTFAAGWSSAAEEPEQSSAGGVLLLVLAAAFLVALVVGALWDSGPDYDPEASDDSYGYEQDVDSPDTSSTDDADAYPATETDVAYGPPESVVEDTFLSSIHESGLSSYGPDDEQVELAHAMCGALDRGAGFEDAMDVLMGAGYGSDAAGAYFGLAVASFCPEHRTW